jgi:putative transposase
MTQTPQRPTSTLWARFRFSVVGSLLSSPLDRGALKTAIRSLAEKTWCHPITGREVRFSAVTIERWYYLARRGGDDPVAVLRRAVRKDRGKVSQPSALELPVALRQPRRTGEGGSHAGASALLLHGPTVHAGSWLGATAPAPGQGTARRGRCGDETADAGDPQL